jgi:hypothetical protein
MGELAIFTGRRNRITDVDGRGGVEIHNRVERIKAQLHTRTGREDVLVDLFEDDLRETAGTIGALESCLRDLLVALNREPLTAGDLLERAEDEGILEHLDYLREVSENLRRRMAQLAVHLSGGA